MGRIDTKDWSRDDYVRFYADVWKAPVIPIQENKKPAIKWVEYQNRRPTNDELDSWFKRNNPWGLSIVLGAVCGNIFSIDLDTDELYNQLKRRGAFPHGACIFKSARGYHVLMRSDIIPYSVKEHNELLDVEYWELGIGGDRALSNMPDTPGRGWIALFKDPVTVDFERWLRTYLSYDRKRESHKGIEVSMWCPYHNDKREGDTTATPSLYINTSKGVYMCHGCGAKGTVADLLLSSELESFEVPEQVRGSVQEAAATRAFKVNVQQLPGVVGVSGEDLIEGIMGGGANAKMLINAERKMGKTTLGCNIGLCMANGLTLFNTRVIQQKSVAFIDFEFTAQAVYDYVGKQVQMLGGWPAEGMFQVIGGYDFKINKPETIEELWRVLRKEPRSEVLIFDSIYAFCSNPNDMEQANAVLDFMNKVMMELHCAIIILHHTNAPSDQLVQKQPLGLLGRMLDRWCGTTLNYTQVGNASPDNVYRRLSGVKRGGQGAVNVLLGYIESTMTLIELNWDDIPGSNEDKTALLGANQRTLIVQQIMLLCKPLGITGDQLAGEWDVSRRELYYYNDGSHIPGDDKWDKIKATHIRLYKILHSKSDGGGEGGCTDREEVCNGDALGMHTAPDFVPKSEEKIETVTGVATGENNKNIRVTGGKNESSGTVNVTASNTHTVGVADVQVKGDKKRVTNNVDTETNASPKKSSARPAKAAKALAPGEPNCDRCKLKEQLQVDSLGECSAQGQWGRVMVIGRAPEDALLLGEQTERALPKLLAYTDIDLKMCHITNICLCQLPKVPKGREELNLTSTMWKACMPRLLAEIQEHRPDTILILGEEAQKALLPEYPLSRYHGKKIKQDGYLYLLMYHPRLMAESTFYSSLILTDFEEVAPLPVVRTIQGDYTLAAAGKAPPEAELVTIDAETKGLYGELLGGSICPEPGTAIYYQEHNWPVALELAKYKHVLGWNLKYDLRVLAAVGFDWHGWELDDAELLAYCMNYENLKLKVMEVQELNVTHPDLGAKTADLPVEEVAKYCNQDTDATRRLWDHLQAVSDERERRVYETIEKPLLPVLVDMEVLGVQVDIPYVKEWRAGLSSELAEITKKLIKDFGVTEAMLNSPKQLGQWLSEQGVILPRTGASEQYATGKEILAGMMDAHPAIKPIIRRRQCGKLISTYADACLRYADANDVVHTQYNQARVRTGRLSSSEPNLQNLPYLFAARRPFIARKGNRLVTIDFSQIDMAALAVMTQDPGLLQAFKDKIDIHNWVSDGLWGDHDPMHRHIIKAADYLATYGGTGATLHVYLNAPMGEFDLDKMGEPPSREECDGIIKKFYELCPTVLDWQTETIKFAHKHGYVEDWHGRRRYLPQLESRKRSIRKAGERQAINFPIAGTAGNIFKISTFLAGRVMTPVLNIHDEWVFDIPEDRIDVMLPKLREAILGIDFPIPLKVKSSQGANLGDLMQ